MFRNKVYMSLVMMCLAIMISACGVPALVVKNANEQIPSVYGRGSLGDSLNIASLRWRDYFTDQYLDALIDTALRNSQELNIFMQELAISRNEIRARTGEYLPTAGIKVGAGTDKVSRFTNIGAMEANTEIEHGKEMPEPLNDFQLSAFASWELDVWHRLRNGKKAAIARYLATIEGKNFMVTNLIAEIANSYYELVALDKQLEIVENNISIQNNALRIVKLQKEASRVTELAVKKFEAQLFHTQSLRYDIRQKITETENRINFLVGRYPQPVLRTRAGFEMLTQDEMTAGIPAQLLENRPDIKRAERELAATKLDVKAAKARFYPSIGISASVGYRAFNPAYLFKSPESLLYSLAGDMVAPLINRNAIKATYYSANAKQIQAVYNYERTVLSAFAEVVNQLSKINNLHEKYELKVKQVGALSQSVAISEDLFKSARADYMEVLMTQRDALEAKFELVETQKEQMNARVNVYQALGGGWR